MNLENISQKISQKKRNNIAGPNNFSNKKQKLSHSTEDGDVYMVRPLRDFFITNEQKIEGNPDYKYCNSEEKNIIKDWLSSNLDEHFAINIPIAPAAMTPEDAIMEDVPAIDITQFEEESNVIFDNDIVRGMIANYIKLLKQKKLLTHKLIGGRFANIITIFASTQDERIQKIILEAAQTGFFGDDANGQSYDYTCEEGILSIWNEFDNEKQKKSFEEEFLTEYWKLYWDEKVFKDGHNRLIQDTFIEKYNEDFVVNTLFKNNNMKICYFDNDTKLWGMGKGYAIGVIYSHLRNNEWKYWKDRWESTLASMPDDTDIHELVKNDIEHKLRKILLNFSGTGNWLNATAKVIHNNMIHKRLVKHAKIQFNLASITRHYFQFKNKAYNLKTGQLENRTRDMYVTASGILNYDFPEDETDADYQKEMETINKMMAQSQPDKKFLEAFKSWFGYCLTGETRAKKFMMNVGKTAENSKSFYLEMFCICFPIYGKMLDKKALNLGNDTGFNKAFASCANCPLRLVYLEELSDKIDIERMKILTHHELSVLPLYQEQLNMQIQFKLAIAANQDLDTGGNNCKGLNRRALLLKWLSQFVDDPDDVDEQNHVYLKDESLLNLFDDDRFKIALFRIYAPYAMKFYTEGLKLPKECKNDFKQIQVENDEWADWMETFEKTDNKEDVISRAELLAEARRLKSNLKLRFTVVKNEFEKRGYNYESQMQKTKNKIKTKGFMTCVKRVE